MQAYRSESEFESELIEKLCTGEINLKVPSSDIDFNKVCRSRLWEYRPDIKTTAQLEENFKEILYRNNQEKLDQPLSQNEFRQVMDQISSLSTPYQAGKFLYGMNGISQVEVDLDDGRHVFLTVFDQAQIGAGNTVYQVVNQIERPAVIAGNKDRRFDVTLLINGLPIYQIELKNENVDIDEALNQIEQYVREGQFSGIFSTVQIFMAMAPYNTKYMAATPADSFNKDFAFAWKDAQNHNVRDWSYIADHMLTIPAAHLLSTNYMILDGSKNKESIKVMRPYQVTATRTALETLRKTDFDGGAKKDGYIWHTTGSGKTITSFKTASLASRLPQISKVVFLVDRKSLTRQTLESYQGYDPESDLDSRQRFTSIENTYNTSDLDRKLRSKGNDIIITSTQKMHRLLKRDGYKAPDKSILFIVDEAHRSTGTQSFEDIQKAFPRSAWIGYSGTPVFDEKRKGSRTVDVFGPLLHAYTIRDAIADKNVLGFKVDFNTTVPDETKLQQLTAYYRSQHPDWSDKKIQEKIDNLTPEDMDDTVRGSFYDNNEKHVSAVVKDIVENWENRSVNWKYNALLTTHVGGNKPSIPMALMYYREFQKVNEDRVRYGLRPLKVAVSVSMDETNSNHMNTVNSGLKDAIEDYNKMFGTKFDSTTVNEYNMDLEDRLRKSSGDGNYLDLVIVVDRLLTGFDAPELNTLYVDRTLRGAGLIQAYSRTNRIHDLRDKPFGNVVNYRWPEYSEQLMNEALAEYSNAENANLTPEEKKKANIDSDVIALPFEDQLEKTKKVIDSIKRLTENLERVPDNPEKQDELLHALRQYNSQIAKLKQYPITKNEDGEIISGFDYKNPEKLIADLGMDEVESNLISVTLSNELKKVIAERDHTIPALIDLRVEHLKDVYIDYDFLCELLENLMNQVHDEKMDEADQTKKQIQDFTMSMDDQDEAQQVRRAANAIYNREYPTPDSGMTYPYKIQSRKELMKRITQAQIAFVDHQMINFRKKWGLTGVVDNGVLRSLISHHEYGKDDLDKNLILEITRKAMSVYQNDSEDETVRGYSKMKYRNALKDAIRKIADEQRTGTDTD